MITKRTPGFVILLTVVTLGLYGLYWVPSMTTDANQVLKTQRFSFWRVFVVGVITLGIGFTVYETLCAYALQDSPEYRDRPWANRRLGSTVLLLNAVAWGLALFSGGLAVLLSIALGIWASWLLQDALNPFADAVAV